MEDSPAVALRAAVVVEQCWHRVPGGTAAAAVETAAALSLLPGIEQIGVSAAHRNPPAPAFRLPIPVRAAPLPRLALYEAWHVLRRPALERFVGPVDVIHATGWAIPPRRAPLVATVHDLAFLDHPEQYSAKGRRLFRQALELIAAEADLVLCSSRATLERAAAAGLDRARLRHAPLGVRVRPAPPELVAATLARHRLCRPFVLAVGTIEPRKNLPALIDAFRRLGRRDLDLVLVGPLGWGPDVRPLLAGLEGQVRLLGWRPADERDALYAAAAVFCYPSLLEGFGLPVLEALAQAAPVVTSAGAATEEAAGAAALLVDPHEPAAIAAGLAEALDDPAVAARLRAAGPAQAARFTWERTAATVAAAYRELV
ncbi:MAG: glycosyltransferase family 4 protein [Acidimicrobiales bacterium]